MFGLNKRSLSLRKTEIQTRFVAKKSRCHEVIHRKHTGTKLLNHYGENSLIFAIKNVDPSLKAQEES